MTAPLQSIRIVEDRTSRSRPDEGFLRVRRLILQNTYRDESVSEPYPCDIVSRRHTDAVAVVIWERTGARDVQVAMRTGIRPPIYFRKDRTDLVQPDNREHMLMTEICAGVLEENDRGDEGVLHRAALECNEEAGYDIAPDAMMPLGNPLFASPGVSDEKIFYCAAQATLSERGEAHGDGSPMEDGGEVLLFNIDEAIHLCRKGVIPDAKTEVGLLRLCHHIGYSPALGCFLDELPPPFRPDSARSVWLLGVEGDPDA